MSPEATWRSLETKQHATGVRMSELLPVNLSDLNMPSRFLST